MIFFCLFSTGCISEYPRGYTDDFLFIEKSLLLNAGRVLNITILQALIEQWIEVTITGGF